MSEIPTRFRRILLLRSLLVQGSWNYEVLIGTGFAFVIVPVLRFLYRDDPDGYHAAVQRHCELFNCHPYLATLAAGAVARLEAEGASPEVIARLKGAIRSSLGSLGDQLFWLAWRPMSALLAILLLLLGLPWWVAVGAFLVCYNTLHLWVRVWGLKLGLEYGMGLGRVLRDAPLNQWSQSAASAGIVLAGICSVLALWRAGPETASLGLAALAAIIGAWLGLRVRRPVYTALLLVWLAGILLGFIS